MKVFSPLTLSFLTLALLELFIVRPQFIFYILAVVILMNLLAAFLYCRTTKQPAWLNFSLLPVLANIITMSYIVIIAQPYLLHLALIILVIFNFIYWRFVWLYLSRSPRYISFSLENLSFYANFILIFLLGSVAYGLRAFLSLDPWWLGSITLTTLAIIIYQGLWVSKINWKKLWLYWLIAWMILLQMFYALMLLPLDYNVLGMIWATNYYVIMSLINDRMNDKVSKSKIKFYIILILIIWLLLLATARWI